MMQKRPMKMVPFGLMMFVGVMIGSPSLVMAFESALGSASFVLPVQHEFQRDSQARFEEGPEESVEMDAESGTLTIRDSESGKVILSTSLPEESLDISSPDESFEIIDEIYSDEEY